MKLDNSIRQNIIEAITGQPTGKLHVINYTELSDIELITRLLLAIHEELKHK